LFDWNLQHTWMTRQVVSQTSKTCMHMHGYNPLRAYAILDFDILSKVTSKPVFINDLAQ
jgi:hypothetical protein